MTRKERAAMNRAIQHLVNAEVAYSWIGTLTAAEHAEHAELLHQLKKTRQRVKSLLDKHTDPVVPPTKKVT